MLSWWWEATKDQAFCNFLQSSNPCRPEGDAGGGAGEVGRYSEATVDLKLASAQTLYSSNMVFCTASHPASLVSSFLERLPHPGSSPASAQNCPALP